LYNRNDCVRYSTKRISSGQAQLAIHPITGMPDAAHDRGIDAALARIVASAGFRSAPRLASFLRFVVETALSGQGDRLKGYTIGVEALGRDPSFDPQTDPIVRVEAGRLRHALAHYYAGAGRDEPLVIVLPRGNYVPMFHRAVAAGARSDDWATLHGLLERLGDLRRQLAAITAEIESAQALLERAARAPQPLETDAIAVLRTAHGRQARQIEQAQGAAAARAR
jgi:hypothetical protein